MPVLDECLVGKQVTFHGENDKGKQSVKVDVCTAIQSHGDGTNMGNGCYNLNDNLFSDRLGNPLFKKGQGCYVTKVDVPSGVNVSAWHLDGSWGDDDCSEQSWLGHGRHRENFGKGPGVMTPDTGANSTCAFRIEAQNGWSCDAQACTKPKTTKKPESSSSECAIQ